jgi:hypothetical protein
VTENSDLQYILSLYKNGIKTGVHAKHCAILVLCHEGIKTCVHCLTSQIARSRTVSKTVGAGGLAT